MTTITDTGTRSPRGEKIFRLSSTLTPLGEGPPQAVTFEQLVAQFATKLPKPEAIAFCVRHFPHKYRGYMDRVNRGEVITF